MCTYWNLFNNPRLMKSQTYEIPDLWNPRLAVWTQHVLGLIFPGFNFNFPRLGDLFICFLGHCFSLGPGHCFSLGPCLMFSFSLTLSWQPQTYFRGKIPKKPKPMTFFLGILSNSVFFPCLSSLCYSSLCLHNLILRQ